MKIKKGIPLIDQHDKNGFYGGKFGGNFVAETLTLFTTRFSAFSLVPIAVMAVYIYFAKKLGVKNICIHKGLPFGPRSYEHSQSSDIGVVAKMFPEMNFLI